MSIFSLKYITEQRKAKQEFPDKVDHNTKRFFNIIDRYRRKKVQPPDKLTDMDITAYYLCDFKKEDLAYFCNSRDTNSLFDLIQSMINKYIEKNNKDERYESLIKRLKKILSSLTEDSIVKIADNFWIGDIYYFKETNSFYVYTDKEDIDFMIVYKYNFNELIINPILNHYKKNNLPYIKDWYKVYHKKEVEERKRKKREEDY